MFSFSSILSICVLTPTNTAPKNPAESKHISKYTDKVFAGPKIVDIPVRLHLDRNRISFEKQVFLYIQGLRTHIFSCIEYALKEKTTERTAQPSIIDIAHMISQTVIRQVLIRSDGATSICAPTFPALTKIRSKEGAVS